MASAYGIFDKQNCWFKVMDLEIGQIIYINENETGAVDIPMENVKLLKKPNKTRSPVYKFFEWDAEISQWKCTTCT